MIPLTVPETRSVVLAMAESDHYKRDFRLRWSAYRRAHQEVARRCKQARCAVRRAFSKHNSPEEDRASGPETTEIAAKENTLSEAQWALIEPLLPPRKGSNGRPLNDHREVLGGILWVAQTGRPWREMPHKYGDFNTAYSRWRVWKKRGLWQLILQTLGWEGELPGPVTKGR